MHHVSELIARGDPPWFVHPSSYVDEPTCVGAETKIHHFCHVMSGARIGCRCVVGQGVFVASTVTVGDDVRIQNNVSLYDGVIVEDFVFLGPSCVFTNVTNPRAEVDRRGMYETTRIGRGATIGANATIVCGVSIGAYAFIAAGAVVTRDVVPYALMVGVPARRVGWMSRHGQRLGRADADGVMVCPESGFRYRIEGLALCCLDLGDVEPLGDERQRGRAYIRSGRR